MSDTENEVTVEEADVVNVTQEVPPAEAEDEEADAPGADDETD